MAFNPQNLAGRTRRVVATQYSDTRSEPLLGSILSDLQSLWVLFDPEALSSQAAESDILLLTNTRYSQSVYSDGTQDESHVARSYHPPESEDYEDDDSLIDNIDGDNTPSQSRLEQLFRHESQDDIDHKIHKWRDNSRDELIDDNVALWDLDENLIQQILDRLLIAKLRTTKSRPRGDFYGDDFFRNCSKADYIKFKKISHNLRHSLTKRNSVTVLRSLPEIINQILVRYLAHEIPPVPATSTVDAMNRQRKRYSSVLSAFPQHQGYVSPTPPLYASPLVDISDTSSSVVVCGGPGNSSWGDL